MSEFVVNADTFNGSRAIFAKASANCLAKTADNVMLLNGDNSAGFLSRFYNKLLVKRLDCCNIDDLCADNLRLKSFACFNCFVYHKAVCDN